MALLDAAIPVLLTAFLGTRIAQGFQDRAAKENRFFEASRNMYSDMISASNKIAAMTGKRIYAAQRLALLYASEASYDEAWQKLKEANIEWNENLLSMEMAVRTLFENSYLSVFEALQAEMAVCIRQVQNKNLMQNVNAKTQLVGRLQAVRADYFSFIRGMYRETSKLHRQMHFGVVIEYEIGQLENIPTSTLIKLLFKSSIDQERVICSPTDFGMPVPAREARLGIHE